MKLSIIIVNYKSRAYLEKCLASIFTKVNLGQEFEVIVVNNGQKEELFGLELIFPGARIIQVEKNLGFGGGNNLAVKIAQGKILFFLNPDTKILSENILQVLEQFSKDSELGIVGSCLLGEDGAMQEWSFGAKITLKQIIKNNLGKKNNEIALASKKIQEVGWVSGTALFIKKELFEKIGGFDEKFFMYFEDVDLCLRVRELGKKVIYFPTFSVSHYGGKSYDEKKVQKKHYYASQDYYFKKHFGNFQLLSLKFLRFFSF